MDNESIGVFFMLCLSIGLTFCTTGYWCDITMDKAILAQEICIKANSKAVSFDRIEVTCENKAVIPLKGD